MVEQVNLEFEYFLGAPAGGGTSVLNFSTNYSEDVKLTQYVITNDQENGIIDTVNVYSTGLVMYQHQTPDTTITKSNKEFVMNESGTFVLVSE